MTLGEGGAILGSWGTAGGFAVIPGALVAVVRIGTIGFAGSGLFEVIDGPATLGATGAGGTFTTGRLMAGLGGAIVAGGWEAAGFVTV
ncbi:MAG: hypothetical protein Q6373_018435, partial [Candidatus Sigynarchaeota archaeon]